SLSGCVLGKLGDNQCLAGLLELSEFVAYVDEDTVLCLAQPLICLLDRFAFFREFVSLSPPVEDLPFDRKAGARQVFLDDLVEIPKSHVDETCAHIGDVLGLLNTAVYFGSLDRESGFSYFGPLLERTIPGALQVGRITTHIARRVHFEIGAD